MKTLVDNFATYLQTGGIGTVNTSIFVGTLPATVDNCVGIFHTGGRPPEKQFDIRYPTIQVVVRNTDKGAALSKADAVYALVKQRANMSLVSGETYVYLMNPLQEPVDIGSDKNNRHEVSLNIELIIKGN